MTLPRHIEPFSSDLSTLRSTLERIGAPEVLAGQDRILIKPNLVNDSPPPVTLPVSAVEALVALIREWSKAEILVAEGTGARDLETDQVFDRLGYTDWARKAGVQLLDLNHAPLRTLSLDGCEVFPQIWLPEILFETYVISFAVLKAHSLSEVTLAMKNMIGCAPPRHYQQGGYWKKSAFHARMHRAIFELNRYRAPDLSLIDGRTGLAEYHLGGPVCEPPVRKLVAGFDPVAVDAAGAELLGVPWRSIGHIQMADGVLGEAVSPETVNDA